MSREGAGAIVRRRLAALSASLWLLLLLAAPPAPAHEVYGQSAAQLGLYLGSNLLASWRVPEARRVVDDMLRSTPEDAGALALDARVLFFEGHYAASLQRLEALAVDGPLRQLVAATVRATAGFQSRASEHFIVSWGDPRDELLVDPALQALEAAYAAVGEALGFVPTRKVRVEIYPTVADFTAVSTLTREEVRTSGTIGLCKFDRLMITSPRATAWGYRWRDTLSHEYLHLAQYRLSAGAAPIWVHEGIAKYLEAAWRGAVGALSPSSRALLVRRLEGDRLIGLDAMSPSIAKLPSAEDAALAFAEVATMVEYLVLQRGREALPQLLALLASGVDDRAAVEEVWDDGFAHFEASWRQWVGTLPFAPAASQIIALQLAEDADAAAAAEHPGVIRDPRAGDFARLGDLLREQDRELAAGIEYAKAYQLSPDAPGIVSRHAWGRMARAAWGEAAEVAQGGLQLYPDLAVLWHRLAEAQLGAGRARAAQRAWHELLELNPFHLPARRGLWRVAELLGDAREEGRQRAAVELLSAPPGAGHGHP